MTISANVATFITDQRELLDRLEQFVQASEYCRLGPGQPVTVFLASALRPAERLPR